MTVSIPKQIRNPKTLVD